MAPRFIRLYMANSRKKRAEWIPHETCDTVIFTESFGNFLSNMGTIFQKIAKINYAGVR